MTGKKLTAIDFIANSTHAIVYRPEWNIFTGSAEASLLLNQIIYWWQRSERGIFYKFQNPCSHSKYRKGDSWSEELGFKPDQLAGALKKISTRVTGKKSIKEIFSQPAYIKKVNKKTGEQELVPNTKCLVAYKTNAERVTYWWFNPDLFSIFLSDLHSMETVKKKKTGNAHEKISSIEEKEIMITESVEDDLEVLLNLFDGPIVPQDAPGSMEECVDDAQPAEGIKNAIEATIEPVAGIVDSLPIEPLLFEIDDTTENRSDGFWEGSTFIEYGVSTSEMLPWNSLALSGKMPDSIKGTLILSQRIRKDYNSPPSPPLGDSEFDQEIDELEWATDSDKRYLKDLMRLDWKPLWTKALAFAFWIEKYDNQNGKPTAFKYFQRDIKQTDYLRLLRYTVNYVAQTINTHYAAMQTGIRQRKDPQGFLNNDWWDSVTWADSIAAQNAKIKEIKDKYGIGRRESKSESDLRKFKEGVAFVAGENSSDILGISEGIPVEPELCTAGSSDIASESTALVRRVGNDSNGRHSGSIHAGTSKPKREIFIELNGRKVSLDDALSRDFYERGDC